MNYNREIRLMIGKRPTPVDLDTLGACVHAYTVHETTGYWQGAQESGYVVSILCYEGSVSEYLRVLRTWCKRLDQDSVLVSVSPVQAFLVPGRPAAAVA